MFVPLPFACDLTGLRAKTLTHLVLRGGVGVRWGVTAKKALVIHLGDLLAARRAGRLSPNGSNQDHQTRAA